MQFVKLQSKRAKPRERIPGSTEVLESSFGKWKELEKQQSHGGFTGFMLGLDSKTRN